VFTEFWKAPLEGGEDQIVPVDVPVNDPPAKNMGNAVKKVYQLARPSPVMTGSARICYCAFIRRGDLDSHGAEFPHPSFCGEVFLRYLDEAQCQMDNCRFADYWRRHRSFAGAE
jgi:hypothetical protein